MYLAGGFGDLAPSHPTQALVSFPSAEDLLDPTTDPVDRLVPILDFLNRLGFVSPPHAGRDDAQDTTLGAEGVTDVVAAIGAVGKDLAGILGKRMGARPDVVDIRGGDCNFYYDEGIGIGSDIGLEAVSICGLVQTYPRTSLVMRAVGLAGRK
ncbi:MAG: hypothetical protein WAT93_14955 [Pontixanthobacter sp.]